MDWLDSLILGVVQGLAEYLPISSSGHLEICREILGLKLPGAEALQFDVVLHVATVLSTIVVLWKEFVPLMRSFFGFKRDENTSYVWKILVSCVPVFIVGMFLKEDIEKFFGVDPESGTSNLPIVGICLMVTALLLCFAYFFRTKPLETNKLTGKVYKPRDITFVDAFVIGISQAVAVLPGLSRSGTTIATGILLGDKREKVAQFSFFMVILPILGQALLDAKDIVTGGVDGSAAMSIGLMPLLIGFVSSFVVGCVACRWMISLVKKGKLVWFAVYCAIVGLICLLY